MTLIRVLNKTRERVLGSRVQLADRWWLRIRGFLGRSAPSGGEGILLNPCRAVHMIGLRFPLDIVFLDREGAIVAQYRSLRPGQVTRFHRRAEYALELPAGTIDASASQPGDRVVWMPVDMESGPVAPAGNGARPAVTGGPP